MSKNYLFRLDMVPSAHLDRLPFTSNTNRASPILLPPLTPGICRPRLLPAPQILTCSPDIHIPELAGICLVISPCMTLERLRGEGSMNNELAVYVPFSVWTSKRPENSVKIQPYNSRPTLCPKSKI